MKACRLLLTILALVLTTTNVLAQGRDQEREMRRGRPERRGNENSQPVSQVTVGTPSYGGNGCPQGTMRAVFAPDNLSFSLLFDQFVAEVKDPTAIRRGLMVCDALIPLQIPSNMQMQITRVDLRGFVGLPEQAKAQLTSIFNFTGRGRGRAGGGETGGEDSGDGNGGRGDDSGGRMKLRFNFQGPVTENYELSSNAFDSAEVVSSRCGGSFQLRIQNQLRVQSSKSATLASITLDSVDGSTQAVYFVSWKQCNQSNAR